MKYIYFIWSLISIIPGTACSQNQLANTAVSFKTNDVSLQRLFDAAKAKSRLNIQQFGKYKVLVEGVAIRMYGLKRSQWEVLCKQNRISRLQIITTRFLWTSSVNECFFVFSKFCIKQEISTFVKKRFNC
jgi:hypothetical protein